MCDPRLQVKVEIDHEPKGESGISAEAVEALEEGIVSAVNGAKDYATDARVSTGHRLSVFFVTLVPNIAQEPRSFDRVARRVESEVDRQRYAPGVSLRGWKVKAVDASDDD